MPVLAPAEELRFRLYRPDPPDGALEAYLAAAREVDARRPEPPRRSVPPRRSHEPGTTPLRGAASIALLIAVVVGLVAGAIAIGGLARRLSPAADPAPAVAAAAAARPDGRLPLAPAPGIPLGSLFGGAEAGGRFDAVGHVVVLSVSCTAVGTLTVTLAREPPTVLTCEAGAPGFAMLMSAAPLHRFGVAVTRDGPVRWSIAVGTMPTA